MKDKLHLVAALPTVEEKLEIYALGRQGQFGDCSEEKPAFYDIKEKYKWEAWNDIRGMDKQHARRRFYELTVRFHGVILE